MSLTKNLQSIKERVSAACERSGRNPYDVEIIAVTKYVGIEETREALDLGLKHIGENRDKQTLEKYEALANRGIWHFIGNLQTKKVKYIIDKVDYIHSLDRISLAEEIEKRARETNLNEIKCFVQVNVSGEETKSGVSPTELQDFIKELKQFSTIKIVGLMTMAPFTEDKAITRSIFRMLKELLEQINQSNVLEYHISELSMGMSNDYEIAIEEGATFVRLGSVLWKDN